MKGIFKHVFHFQFIITDTSEWIVIFISRLFTQEQSECLVNKQNRCDFKTSLNICVILNKLVPESEILVCIIIPMFSEAQFHVCKKLCLIQYSCTRITAFMWKEEQTHVFNSLDFKHLFAIHFYRISVRIWTLQSPDIQCDMHEHSLEIDSAVFSKGAKFRWRLSAFMLFFYKFNVVLLQLYFLRTFKL